MHGERVKPWGPLDHPHGHRPQDCDHYDASHGSVCDDCCPSCNPGGSDQ